MQNKTQVLDHGYIQLVESWGSDERIIEAARMSTNKGFQGWGGGECNHGICYCNNSVEQLCGPCRDQHSCTKCGGSGYYVGDEKLLRYLYEHKHATPFEMAGAIIEVQAPIFVFREWHRHRTQSYNEMSARYTPLPDINYMPSVDRLLESGGSNKQATGTGAKLDLSGAETFRLYLGESYREAEDLYQKALKVGVPKELARLCLPVARYSRMRASANLRNWLAFLTLRLDNAAQWEIRQYAQAVHSILSDLFPRTMGLFNGK